MSQPTLFDEPRAHHDDPATSKAAARRMKEAAPALEAQILDVLGRYRQLTKDECGIALAIDPRRWPSISSALTRLKNSGQVEWTGEIRGGQNVHRLASVDVPTGNRL